MANKRVTSFRDSAEREALVQINLLIDNVTAIAAKLDSDGGVTDTDYDDEVTAEKITDSDTGNSPTG